MKDIVTKENFAEAYPELCASIEKEAFEKGFSEGKKAGELSGAESEKERIKGVEEQLIPGHEVLIASLKYDGKTTGPEAAVMVLKKEKELAKSRLADMIDDGEKVKVKDAIPPVIDRVKEDPSKKIEEMVKERMEKDQKISYIDALNRVQKDNPDLARQIKEEMDAYREKK